MVAWKGVEQKYHHLGVLHKTKIPRKPVSHDIELKTTADGETGILMEIDIVEENERQRQKTYAAEFSEGTALTLRDGGGEKINCPKGEGSPPAAVAPASGQQYVPPVQQYTANASASVQQLDPPVQPQPFHSSVSVHPNTLPPPPFVPVQNYTILQPTANSGASIQLYGSTPTANLSAQLFATSHVEEDDHTAFT
ncbi:hypothetical protein PC117_g6872 [Phytophthora cactorum]|uniref:Uncharacterized protein n=1 Tax=Phytophthora cactorum TaxID=29920 RepID=A0A8T1E841_9STRA|nr:hypothetical protein PC117_g6872 [Phytophthora cactorum]